MTIAAQDTITAKLERQFDLLDADKDGRVNGAEFATIADRFIKAYGLSEDDHRARCLRAINAMYWAELVRHVGAEGNELAKDEFVVASRLASIDSSRLNVVDGLARTTFDVIDVDGDLQISKEEFLRFQRDVWAVEAPEAMDVFDRVDIDGDGSISHMEFIRTVREYFLSMDPEAPGSMIFGRV
ncbi:MULTISPECIES: EF-hand domain-containing protein [unclassified Streptomyces]|uniref:EF-hand domain-containing protein n=1 Tax=unclassified Streptomyces TaxID=2593676 RepID=UPI00331C781C